MRLSEIGRPGIRIHLFRNLIDTRQRVHHDRLLRKDSHHFVIDDILPARLLIVFDPVPKPLPLNPRLINHIHFSGNGNQVFRLFPLNSVFVQIGFDVIFHPDDSRRNEIDPYLIILRHQIRQ